MKWRFTLLIIVIIFAIATPVLGGALTKITFSATVHNRPVRIVITQNESSFLHFGIVYYHTAWTIEIVELDVTRNATIGGVIQ